MQIIEKILVKNRRKVVLFCEITSQIDLFRNIFTQRKTLAMYMTEN